MSANICSDVNQTPKEDTVQAPENTDTRIFNTENGSTIIQGTKGIMCYQNKIDELAHVINT